MRYLLALASTITPAALIATLALVPTAASPGITTRVSVDSAGNQGNGASGLAGISADGRLVAFYSDASNLVTRDNNGLADVFAHDRQTGITERVSVTSYGDEANGGSIARDISADGRFVLFDSTATNLLAADTNGQTDVFVHDRLTGVTERASLGDGGSQTDNGGFGAGISADGRFVVFLSEGQDLVANDTNNARDVFVRDREAGLTARVSVNTSGEQANGASGNAGISDDGRFVGFASYASNLVPEDTVACPASPDPINCSDVFIHDRDADEDGILDEPEGISTVMASVASSGAKANGASELFALSADGHVVVFGSTASNLVTGDTNGYDIFVRDTQTGTTERVSVDSAGNEQNGFFFSFGADISAGGRFVTFDSLASNLVPGDTNGIDVFVRDRQAGTTERVSVSSTGEQALCLQVPECSVRPSISADGRFVAFQSSGSNLVEGDTNTCGPGPFTTTGECPDLFVHDRALLFLTAMPTSTPTATTLPARLPETGADPSSGPSRHWPVWLLLAGSIISGAGVIAYAARTR